MPDTHNPLQSARCVARVVALVVCLLLFPNIARVEAQKKGIENLRITGKAFASVAKEVSPAVVFIQVEKKVARQAPMGFFSPFGGGPGDDFFEHFFGRPYPGNPPHGFQQAPRKKQRVVGQGSGFIISTDGYILTNNHVVENATKVTVKLEDGREFTAKTVGTDPHSDVAVIKVDASGLPVLPLGDSDKLEVGEWVIAVGNPFGLSHTITAGIVSAKGRSSIGIADYENFIQTDAAINPGNSGGPLVNLEGKAVGMNTAIFSRSGGYMGIGFAIPINMVKTIKNQLIKNGCVIRGYLGVVIQNLTPDLAKSFGIKEKKGILVSQVTKDSPAYKAGIKQGDIIVSFDGQPVEKIEPFRNRVALTPPGTKKKLTVLREGKHKTLTVTIGRLPDSTPSATVSSTIEEKLGITVRNLTQELAERFGLKEEQGVVVVQVSPGSDADLKGIRPGVLIQEINRKKIHDVKEFQRAIEKTGDHGTILMLIKEGSYSRFVTLRMD